jgi:hypothetical protein
MNISHCLVFHTMKYTSFHAFVQRRPKKGIRSSSMGFCVPCRVRCADQLLRQPRTNALLALQGQCAGRGAVLVSDLLRNPKTLFLAGFSPKFTPCDGNLNTYGGFFVCLGPFAMVQCY